LGSTVRDQAIVYDEIASSADRPVRGFDHAQLGSNRAPASPVRAVEANTRDRATRRAARDGGGRPTTIAPLVAPTDQIEPHDVIQPPRRPPATDRVLKSPRWPGNSRHRRLNWLPGQLKDALDRASRPYGESVLTGKPIVVIGASQLPTAAHSQAEVRMVLAGIGAQVIDADLPLVRAHEPFDGTGQLCSAAHRQSLGRLLEQLSLAATPTRRPRPHRRLALSQRGLLSCLVV
jgi:hypothetical protein